MNDLVLSSADFEELRGKLLADSRQRESCAVLFASRTIGTEDRTRFLVREIAFPSENDYRRRGPLEAELSPAFVARVSKRALIQHAALVFAHTHPGVAPPRFSILDNEGERMLSEFLSVRYPSSSHVALVVSQGGIRARILGTDDPVRVVSVGGTYSIHSSSAHAQNEEREIFERQIRAFGEEGQRSLGRLRVGIVGLGGVGSIVAEMLVHLGISDFVLIDPDTIESSNLNRVVNASAKNLGEAKVDVAARYISSFSNEVRVQTFQEDVTHQRSAKRLLSSDVMFSCTDTHGSRAVLQQIAYQYFIPCIDVGTTIAVEDAKLSHIFGRVQLLSPGLACLICSNLLDPNEVRGDMMTAFERQQDPYLRGARVPAPSVISLNGTVASLAVSMLIGMVTEAPIEARYLLYDAIRSRLRSVSATPQSNCYVCSRSGAFGRGDTWPIFGRED